MSDITEQPSLAGTPRILYGTAWKKERTAELVALALRVGYRAIDTACQPKHYDEPGVGRAIALALDGGLERRALYVQTKFTSLRGQDPKRVPYDVRAPINEQVQQSCAASLRNLGVEQLDCLVLHSPLPTPDETFQVWQSMEALFSAGQVARLGISNCYDLRLLRELVQRATIKPSVVQNRFYAETGFDRELRAFCRSQGIRYQSFWTLTANPSLLSSNAVTAVAKRHGVTAAQAFLRALTQVGVSPLTGTTSEQHMRDDLELFQFELEPSELAAVVALFEP